MRIINQAIERILDTRFQKSVGKYLNNWKAGSRRHFENEQKNQSLFEKILLENWGEALHLLFMVNSIAHQLRADLHQQLSEQDDSLSIVMQVLFRLHLRGCQVASESLLLLQNGLADGAYARWRTLHELAVTAIFISKHGEKVAERYLMHLHVQDYKKATVYQTHAESVYLNPINEKIITQLKSNRDEVVARFGKSFARQYGWAEEVLKKDGHKQINFYEIEKNIDYNHFRPFVETAHVTVHAGSKGAFFSMGSPPGDYDSSIAGKSIYGLCEPGQHTAWSIYLLTNTLLLADLHIDLQGIVQVKALGELATETFYAFADAEAQQGEE